MFVKVRGVSIRYLGGRVLAVDNVSLELGGNDMVGVIGPNGSGKTSLLRAIGGLVSYSGAIYIDGLEVSRTPRRTLARLLSYSSDITVPEALSLTVLEAVLTSMYPVLRGFIESREDVERAYNMLRELGIDGLADRRLSELSSGELKKALIAMAIARKPRVLLLDEPDAHLDIASKRNLAELLSKLRGRALVIFATHDILWASYTATKIILLKQGRVVAAGRVEDVVKPDILEKVYGVKFTVTRLRDKVIPIPLYQ